MRSKTSTSVRGSTNRHFSDNTPLSAMMCVGALVSLIGCNMHPKWGLHNGALGYVVNIVFRKGVSPNDGGHPAYVVVDFPCYVGPAWDDRNPKVSAFVLSWDRANKPLMLPSMSICQQHVPIPVICRCCNHMCCEREFLPLQLSFAKTIDTFQGLNAGPVDVGKPPNTVQRLTCDPGSRQFEASKKPGLFYTMCSRGTTIGHLSQDGLRYDSSIYFYDFGCGKAPLSTDRITDLRRSPQSKKVCKRTVAQERWMAHLARNEHRNVMSLEEQQRVIEWAKATKTPLHVLDRLLLSSVWQKTT